MTKVDNKIIYKIADFGFATDNTNKLAFSSLGT